MDDVTVRHLNFIFLVETETFIISRNKCFSFLSKGVAFLFVNFRFAVVTTSLPVSSLGPQMLLQLSIVFKEHLENHIYKSGDDIETAVRR